MRLILVGLENDHVEFNFSLKRFLHVAMTTFDSSVQPACIWLPITCQIWKTLPFSAS
jgi:hypothetical protein